MKLNFFRIDYPAAYDLSLLAKTRNLAGLTPELYFKLRPGDYLLAARYNADKYLGEVRMLGRVQSNGAVLDIDWHFTEFDLRPSQQGRLHWSKPFFRFADNIAEKYSLALRCNDVFGVEAENGIKTNSTQLASPPPDEDPGHIYVIKSAYGYKIGKSRRLHDRTRLFSVKLPFPIEIVLTGWSGTYSRTERELHLQFAAKRLEGEWFSLDDQDLSMIRTRLISPWQLNTTPSAPYGADACRTQS